MGINDWKDSTRFRGLTGTVTLEAQQARGTGTGSYDFTNFLSPVMKQAMQAQRGPAWAQEGVSNYLAAINEQEGRYDPFRNLDERKGIFTVSGESLDLTSLALQFVGYEKHCHDDSLEQSRTKVLRFLQSQASALGNITDIEYQDLLQAEFTPARGALLKLYEINRIIIETQADGPLFTHCFLLDTNRKIIQTYDMSEAVRFCALLDTNPQSGQQIHCIKN